MTDRYIKDPDKVSQLTPTQYEVTQEGATEPAFHNEFWDNKESGSLRRRGNRRTTIRFKTEV